MADKNEHPATGAVSGVTGTASPCSAMCPHPPHTYGGRPVKYCAGIEPKWKKCSQCGRENSEEKWQKNSGKCPNCADLFERENAAPSGVGESAGPCPSHAALLEKAGIPDIEHGSFLSLESRIQKLIDRGTPAGAQEGCVSVDVRDVRLIELVQRLLHTEQRGRHRESFFRCQIRDFVNSLSALPSPPSATPQEKK